MDKQSIQTRFVYKICTSAAWADAVAKGAFAGSAFDLADSFVHLSTGTQVSETARRHFSGQNDLVIVAFDAAQLGPSLWWEPSRGGELFPHLYAVLEPAAALWLRPLALGADGVPIVPAEVV